ncbi:MAG: choice-of-anchor B family protein [Candidatus Promineifilaceae bacterium]
MYQILHRFRALTLVFVLLLLVVSLFTWSQLAAQTSEPEQFEESAPVLTDSMRDFLANRAANKEEGEMPEAMSATPCVSGMAGPYACENVDLMNFMPLSAFNATLANDIWGWTDPMDEKEYVLLGLNNGTAFVDITDPENPVYLGKLPTQTSSSTWRDIKVYNNYAFIVSEASNHGMQVFDLTELRSVVSPPVTFSTAAHYSDFGHAHNIVINEDSGYAYGVGTGTCSGGLHMVNIQNPLMPTNAGCYSGDGYTHDAQCVIYSGPDADYTGAEVCFNSNEDTLTIVDVTNKAAPALISRTGYAGSAYTHQGWLAWDQRYFLLDDEEDEAQNGHNTYTYIWDLLDLDNPQLMGHYTGPNPSIDHNLYIIGNHAYESNYTSGLQILDVSHVANANLQQIAFFDSYAPNNNTSFYGSWSNYPYYNSGVVAVTGIDEGLYILKPTIDIGVLERDKDVIEETVTMGDVVTNTLTVSNTGTISFTFTTSESADWADVSPAGGTLEPGQSMALSVVFDSSATIGSGTYTTPLSFVGSFGNVPGDVDLVLHVEDAPGDTYYSYFPAVFGVNGGNVNATHSAETSSLWLLPLIGTTAVVGIGRGKKRFSNHREVTDHK